MKTIKYQICIILIFIIQPFLLCQELLLDGELIFKNNSDNGWYVYVQIYPNSMVFNGDDKYNLRLANSSPQNNFHFINGRNSSEINFLISPQGITFNHDNSTALSLNKGAVGYGEYKFIMTCNNYNFKDSCTIEWDAGYPYNANTWSADLLVFFEDNNNNPRIQFQWGGDTAIYDISYVNKQITAWDQQYALTSSGYLRRLRDKNYGNFIYDTQDSNLYIIPLDSRKDCSLENQEYYDVSRNGVLTLNLTIDKTISTRDTLIDSITNLDISKNALFKINDSNIFNMITSSSPSGGYTNLIVQDSSFLLLRPSSKIIVSTPNKITLKSKGTIILNTNAVIHIKPGAMFCNEGGRILGSGRIFYEGGIHQSICNQLSDYLMQDSVKFILDSNAVLQIPYNSTLHFRGNEYAESGFLLDNVNGKSKYNVVSEFSIKFYINIKS